MAKPRIETEPGTPFHSWMAEVEATQEITEKEKAFALLAWDTASRGTRDAERLLGCWQQRAREQGRKAGITCTRRIEWDAGHRLLKHEGKCRYLHGHRYAAEITCASSVERLDACGRVVDFGLVKELVGGWVDEHWDHAMVLEKHDPLDLEGAVFRMDKPPTAENLVGLLAEKAQELMYEHLTVTRVRLYETPNCWADWCL